MDNASILSRRDLRPLPKPTRKEVSPAPGTKTGKPILNRCARLFGNFELNRPTCFLLNHRCGDDRPIRAESRGSGPSKVDAAERQTCMGLFPVKGVFPAAGHLIGDCCLGLLRVLCSERERPFFVPSPAIRFPERAEGVKGPKR
jgi:hypothetical protein